MTAVVGDVYAAITEADVGVVETLATAMEVSTADEQQMPSPRRGASENRSPSPSKRSAVKPS